MVLAKRQLLGLQVLEKKLLLDVVHDGPHPLLLYTFLPVHLILFCSLSVLVLYCYVLFMMSPGTWYMVHKPQSHVLGYFIPPLKPLYFTL